MKVKIEYLVDITGLVDEDSTDDLKAINLSLELLNNFDCTPINVTVIRDENTSHLRKAVPES
jgi:hypothetical protein